MYKLLAVISLFIGTVVLLTSGQNFNNPSEAHSRFCAPFNGDCDKCVSAQNSSLDQGGRCYFCRETNNGTKDACLAYGYTLPIQATTQCPNLNYNIDNCTVTALVYVIAICIVVMVVFVLCCIFWCCCCCYCQRRRIRQREAEDEAYMQEKDAIRQKSTERRAERKAKNDEIRKKYGLNTETTGTYKRLDN